MKIQKLKSDEHAKSRFAPHGKIEVWPEGAVIHYDISGPFNQEGIKAFGRTMVALLKNWQPEGPFASLSIWRGSMLISADALAAYDHLLKVSRAHFPKELVNVWFVPDEVEGRGIMLPKWQALYATNGYPLEIFDTESAARARLRWYFQQAALSG